MEFIDLWFWDWCKKDWNFKIYGFGVLKRIGIFRFMVLGCKKDWNCGGYIGCNGKFEKLILLKNCVMRGSLLWDEVGNLFFL